MKENKRNIKESSKAPRFPSRNFKLSQEGIDILNGVDGAAELIQKLGALPDFDKLAPFTDTYFHEIGNDNDLEMLLRSGYIYDYDELDPDNLDEATWQQAYQNTFSSSQTPQETQDKVAFLTQNFNKIPSFVRGDFELESTADLVNMSKTELENAYNLTKKEVEKVGALTEALEKLVGKTIKLKESQKESYLNEKTIMKLKENYESLSALADGSGEHNFTPEQIAAFQNATSITHFHVDDSGDEGEEFCISATINGVNVQFSLQNYNPKTVWQSALLHAPALKDMMEDLRELSKDTQIDEAIKVNLDTLAKKPNEIMKAAQKTDIMVTENKKTKMIESLTKAIETKTGKKVIFEAKDKEEKVDMKPAPEAKNPQEPTLGNVVPPSVIKDIDTFVTNTLAEIDKSTSELRAVKKNITSGSTATDEDFKSKTDRISFLLTQLGRISLFCSNTIKAGKFDKGLLYKIIELKA